MPPYRGQGERTLTAFTVTFASGSPTSNTFVMAPYGLGLVWLASGVTGFYLGANVGSAGGALSLLHDGYNSKVGNDVACILPGTQLTAVRAVPMPPFWFGASEIQLVAHDGTGSGIPQDSARVCTITLKS
jgi:hypothetical protein